MSLLKILLIKFYCWRLQRAISNVCYLIEHTQHNIFWEGKIRRYVEVIRTLGNKLGLANLDEFSDAAVAIGFHRLRWSKEKDPELYEELLTKNNWNAFEEKYGLHRLQL